MAVDSPVLYNDWWVYLRDSMGSSHLNPSDKQIHNATKIYNGLLAQGYTSEAACGILGNMQTESGLSPGALQNHLSSLPNNGEHLADLTNSVMLGYASQNDSGYGTGLIQWDSYTTTPPAGNTIVSFAIRYNYEWYDGDCQLFRLQREYETDNQYHYWYANNHSPAVTWSQFKNWTGSVSEATDIFRQCRERSSGSPTGNQYRRDNAQYWYDYFSGGPTPPTPDDWISGTNFAALAEAYDPDITGVQIPYTQMDCYQFVQTVWRDIDAVSSTDKLCNPVSQWGTAGTNTLWRQNVSPYPTWTFNTTSPDNQNPTPVLWWKGTISDCIAEYGEIPAGALLFHQIGEDDNPRIPNYYRGDGIGNFAHVGIYIGNSEVMQSGGRDSSSVPGGGVHRSAYDSSAWNYVAFVVYVDCTGGGPTPPPPPPPPAIKPAVLDTILAYVVNNKKDVRKNVKGKWCW